MEKVSVQVMLRPREITPGVLLSQLTAANTFGQNEACCSGN